MSEQQKALEELNNADALYRAGTITYEEFGEVWIEWNLVMGFLEEVEPGLYKWNYPKLKETQSEEHNI